MLLSFKMVACRPFWLIPGGEGVTCPAHSSPHNVLHTALKQYILDVTRVCQSEELPLCRDRTQWERSLESRRVASDRPWGDKTVKAPGPRVPPFLVSTSDPRWCNTPAQPSSPQPASQAWMEPGMDPYSAEWGTSSPCLFLDAARPCLAEEMWSGRREGLWGFEVWSRSHVMAKIHPESAVSRADWAQDWTGPLPVSEWWK